MEECKWCGQKGPMTVGVQSWAAPNAPCLSEGLSGVGSGPCPPQPAQLMHSEIVPSHHIWQGNARVSPSPTGTLPHCYNKSSVFAEGSLNTSQSILGHKTIACPQIHFCWKHTAKIAVIENSVNRTISSTLSLKVPPKAQKQPKIRLAEWRLSKRILFTALTKKKKNDIHLQHFFSKFTWQRLRYCFILTQHTTALWDWLCYFGKSWDLWTRKSGAY